MKKIKKLIQWTPVIVFYFPIIIVLLKLFGVYRKNYVFILPLLVALNSSNMASALIAILGIFVISVAIQDLSESIVETVLLALVFGCDAVGLTVDLIVHNNLPIYYVIALLLESAVFIIQISHIILIKKHYMRESIIIERLNKSKTYSGNYYKRLMLKIEKPFLRILRII